MSKVLAMQIYNDIENEMGQLVMVTKTMSSDQYLINVIKNENSRTEEEMADEIAAYLKGIGDRISFKCTFISDFSKRCYTENGIKKVIDPFEDSYDIWYLLFAKKMLNMI